MAQRRRARRATAPAGPRRLNQHRAGFTRPDFRDVAALAPFARAVFARHQPERTTDVPGTRKARDVIERRAIGERDDRAHARHRLQAHRDRIGVGGCAVSARSSSAMSGVSARKRLEQRRQHRAQRRRQRRAARARVGDRRYCCPIRSRKPSWRRSARRCAIRPVRIRTSCRRTPSCCRSVRCARETRCAARKSRADWPRRAPPTSRSSVLMRRCAASPYIGA